MASPEAASRDAPSDASAHAGTSRYRKLGPTVPLMRYAPAAVLIAILLPDSNRSTDPDLWGHLRFGEVFIAARHLLHHDTYSYSAAGHRWRDHEWLAEVVMALVYDAAGVVGLKLWKFACTAAAMLFVADSEASTGAPPAVQLTVLFAAACGFVLQAQLRPQMFSLVLFGALLALLARDTYRRDARLWLTLPLMALWANLHGGFFIGLAALALYSVVAFSQDVAAHAGWRRGAGLMVLTAASAASTLVNPYGGGIWGTVTHALANPYTRNVIRDWQPFWWAMLAQWHSAPSGVVFYVAVIAMVGALATAMAAAPSADDLPLIAVAAMMVLAAFVSVRNMALAAMALGAPLAHRLAMQRAKRAGEIALAMSWRPAAHVAAFMLAAAMAFGGGLFSSRLALDRAYPAGALAFMKSRGLHGNVMGEFGWGEYLIWHAAAVGDRVFIDGRYDTVYPFKVIGEYLEFYFDQPGANRVLDSYPHDFVLIGSAAPARHLMARRADWKLIYRDADSLLYARAGAPAAEPPGLPVTAAVPAGQFP